MHLKSIKLAGFKSFADATTIPVRSYMNAVVGPNGCGKSNIIDAIRWVIGESSAKQLRGQSMADVIFNGTSNRKPVSKALVELIFDNQDGRAGGEYAKFSEVAIRREIERDGQSSYFINGTSCRRRDIIDIFLGTGLGPRSYAIIEQGVIAKIIEAKPSEFRVHLEEVAGISKYKERRRDTENRIHRTQENLSRINDLCEELTKQLRHLKRQANAAERYQHFKNEERLLQAQIKGLQWRDLSKQSQAFDDRINAANLQHEEQLADQRHLETNIEKFRINQVQAADQQNEVQKKYYGLGAEIARVEQRIKDAQEQTHQWRQELEAAEDLWQELTESSAEHQDQIQDLTEEVAELSPRAGDIQQSAKQAQHTLSVAEVDMNTLQLQWDDFQQQSAAASQKTEVARTHIANYQRQIENLQQRRERLSTDQDNGQLLNLNNELAPLDSQVSGLVAELESVQAALNQFGQEIIAQRQDNADHRDKLNELQRQLQLDEGRYASLNAMQESALSGDQQANEWLAKHHLDEATRLGKTITVNPGWQLAVETVLVGYFDAVCVDDVGDYAEQFNLEQGCLTLVDNKSVVSGSLNGHRLADQVQSDWPIASWLSHVFTADSTEHAMAMRHELSVHESVITQDGLWLGAHWIRTAKPADSEAGVLAREHELTELKGRIQQRQRVTADQKMVLQQGEQQLEQLEAERDHHHKHYQTVSGQLTQTKAQYSAKQSRHDEMAQQQQRMQLELTHCASQIEQSESSLSGAKTQLEQCEQELTTMMAQKNDLVNDRDRLGSALRSARETAQREQQKADEFDIRLASNQSQLALLQQTVSRSERQMEQLRERREHLAAQLTETDGPLDHLNLALQGQLSQRVVIEKELHAAEEHLESTNQQLRQFESRRHDVQNHINEIKDHLQTIRIEHQTITVRQATIQEQLTESDFDLEQVLSEMPQDAVIKQWQERCEKISNKISRLGPINLAAIEEYDQVNERKTYLDQQLADLHEALDILQNAMHKIDRETRQKFRDTFDKVNEGFKALFPRIFGGGNACLELEEDNLLTSGVIVRAQPPGKRNSTIHMLSGGEKALTAISLVFAMFQLNPAPFCILDEVDAPLDDVNVGRFCQLVKEMSKVTQFIVISHNKVTIEASNHLMGVTMQEPGVSRIVSVDIEEAIALSEV
jgi:chromosome segregation protein